jgi:CrcB protein
MIPRGRLELLAAVAVGGAAGTLIRAGLERTWPAGPGAWPWATFGANLAGAFVLGLVVAALPAWRRVRPLLGTGFCGALTTFSTFQVELIRLARAHETLIAGGYAAASVGLGLAAATVGARAGRRFHP